MQIIMLLLSLVTIGAIGAIYVSLSKLSEKINLTQKQAPQSKDIEVASIIKANLILSTEIKQMEKKLDQLIQVRGNTHKASRSTTEHALHLLQQGATLTEVSNSTGYSQAELRLLADLEQDKATQPAM